MTTTHPEAPPLAPPKRLVVVDDDKLFLGVFAANLRAGGYLPVCFDDSTAALATLIAGTRACACVLDLDMPGLDGLSFLRELKRNGVHLPVVFVTSHSSPMFEEQSLREGAAEFIDKSRGPGIILYRIGLVTQQRQATLSVADAPDLQRGQLLLRRRARRALWRGVEVPLSRTEFDVVLYLATAAGRDVAYREIYDVIKGQGFVAGSGEEGYRANVRATIKRIRRKFEEVTRDFDSLGTYPGFGYRWRNDG
jgi:two-component system, OmpR family, response regulator ChvI